MQLEYDKLYLIFILAYSIQTENLTALISLTRCRLKLFTENSSCTFSPLNFTVNLEHHLIIAIFLQCDHSSEYLTEQDFWSQWKKSHISQALVPGLNYIYQGFTPGWSSNMGCRQPVSWVEPHGQRFIFSPVCLSVLLPVWTPEPLSPCLCPISVPRICCS